jgi:hypothetical protein
MADRRRRTRAILCSPILLAAVVACVCSPTAATAAVGWNISALTNTTLARGGTSTYRIQFFDAAPTAASGAAEPIAFRATLPKGLKALTVNPVEVSGLPVHWSCAATVFPTQNVKCTDNQDTFPPGSRFGFFEMSVEAAGSLSLGAVKTTTVEISGGTVPASSSAVPVTIQDVPPPFGLAALDGLTSADESGTASTAAASHPRSSSVSFDLNTVHNPQPVAGDLWPVEPFKDAFTELPPGLVGAPTAIPQCTVDLLTFEVGGGVFGPRCDERSQLGVATVRFKGQGPLQDSRPIPVFNMVPPPGVPARFGFNVLGTLVMLDARVRSRDYGITLATRDAPEGVPLAGTTVTLWGTPASPVHTPERSCSGKSLPPSEPGCKGASEESAFLRNPTSCSGPEALRTTMQVDSWAHPGAYTSAGEPDLGDPAWKSGSFLWHEAPGYPRPPSEWGPPVQLEHCDQVPFEPSITLRPTTNRADSPSGLDFDLAMPQSCWEAGQAAATCQADVKDAFVTQPIGMRVNPATADGLSGCSEEQIGFVGAGFPLPNPTHFTNAEPECPDASKIGTVEIESPLIPDTLQGGIFQARQGENPFGSTLAFYAVAEADGVMIKLPAEVVSDPQSGQVTTIFRDSPQLPFSHYKLHFFGGPRGPLITPPTCGAYTTRSSFTGWASPEEAAHPEDSFEITEGPNGQPCSSTEGERPFGPSFEAGTENPLGGAYSPFVLNVGREDGMQELSGIATTLPEGLLAKLAGVPYCPEAAIAAAERARGLAELSAPSCPAASQVGVTDAAAGAGAEPFHSPGKVYLAGPYRGAPLSLAIVTPAVAGPLDLGNVVVRAALYVDPQSAQARVVSDPIPSTIVEGGDGFPLDLRQIVVDVDRPGFTLNPTSCDPMAVGAQITALQGATADVSSRFQVGDCQSLPFAPKLSLKLRGQTRRSGHPALRALLSAAPGQANIAASTVSLPHSEFVAQSHLNHICTRVQYAEGGGGGGGCPKGSTYGFARAYTPLLEAPLEGPVYLRSNGGERVLPDLVASLGGQIHIDLVGFVSSNERTQGIQVSFAKVPDAPVSRFELTMPAGRRSLLENSTNICQGAHRATVLFDAQNGKVADSTPALKVSGCPKGRKGHEHRRR